MFKRKNDDVRCYEAVMLLHKKLQGNVLHHINTTYIHNILHIIPYVKMKDR